MMMTDNTAIKILLPIISLLYTVNSTILFVKRYYYLMLHINIFSLTLVEKGTEDKITLLPYLC